MPRLARASSNASDWALIRNSTATSPGGRPRVAQAGDVLGDRLGLGDLVGVGGVGDRAAGGPLGTQLDAAARRLLQQGVGGGDDLGGGAVVAGQLDRRGRGKLGREVAEVGRVGAGEGVDGLRRVADDAQLVATAQPEVEQGRLERRDVLELVDDEAFVLAPDLGRDPLVVGEQAGSEEQDVLHVHPALGALDVLVAAEDPRHGLGSVAGDRAPAGRRDAGIVVGMDVADLGPLDLRGQVAQQRLVGVDPAAAGGGGQDPDLGLGERGQLGAVDVGPEVAELAQGGGVEGPGLDPGSAEPAQSPPHLAGGAGGERDREDLGGLVDPGRDAVGDPVGDRPGLAGAGSGEHPDRPPQGRGDLALLGVESGEQVVGVDHAGTTPPSARFNLLCQKP